MKAVRKLFFAVLVLVMAFSAAVLSAQAADELYFQTSKANVPVWSSASSKSTKLRTIPKSKTVVKVTEIKMNYTGTKKWYKLSDGGWVYSGNVTAHKHKYSGGICTGLRCGYEYKLSVVSYKGNFKVTNDSGASIWSRPYSVNSKKIRVAEYNEKLKVVAKTINVNSEGKAGNLWYKLSDGSWVYSDNVTRYYTVQYFTDSGVAKPNTQYMLSGKSIKLASVTTKKTGYLFQGWATSSSSTKVAYKAGATYSAKKDLKLYDVWVKCVDHVYVGGICNKCQYEYPLTLNDASGTYVVTAENGAQIWSRPYSTNSKKVRVAAYNTALTVVASVINVNSDGTRNQTWYKLSDGNWVYSGNVARRCKVTYNANGGKKAPASITYLYGQTVTVSKSIPVRTGYVFQGWTNSKNSTYVLYKPGKKYSMPGDITLYAVWSKHKHSYDKYGICSSDGCGKEFQLEYKALGSVFAANSNGAVIYKRPYAKASEKVKNIKKNALVYVLAYAKNSNGHTWYKLNDGNWVRKDDVTKKSTYFNVGDIPVSYYKVLEKAASDKSWNFSKISGESFCTFYTGDKVFYLAGSALDKKVNNTKLAEANKALTAAVTERSSDSVKLIVHSIGTTDKANWKACNAGRHEHKIWVLWSFTVEAGFTGSESFYVKCKKNSDKTVSLMYCPETKRLIEVKKDMRSIVPKVSAAVTPYKQGKTDVGWFTDYRLEGKGRGKKKKYELKDYVELFTGTTKTVDSVLKAVYTPTIKNTYDAVADIWEFFADSPAKNESEKYSSEIMSLTVRKDGKNYRFYKMSVKSPISLVEKGDYLEAEINTYELNKNQDITVNVSFVSWK